MWNLLIFLLANLLQNIHIRGQYLICALKIDLKSILRCWNVTIFLSHLLDFKNLLKIYFSFIHIYINYAYIAWASTFKTKLQAILKKQKHAARIIFHINRFDHSRPLLKEIKALNKINIIKTLKFMHKTKYGINPWIFLPKFRDVDLQCPTRFSQNSFYYKKSACKTTSLQ